MPSLKALEDVRGLQVNVETLIVREGRKLGRIRPDERGFYPNIPVAALGVTSRNNTYYFVDDFVDQIVNERSYVNRMVKDGTLYGEYGHPNIAGMTENLALNRLMVIDEKLMSHNIGALRTGDLLESGGRLLNADIKPAGPYGQTLKDSFDDPCLNTAFSLRSITEAFMKDGVSHRKMKKLVTFDAVAAGGYAEASKRFAPGVEGFEHLAIRLNPYDGGAVFTEVALECFTNHELNEIYGSKHVELRRRTVTHLPGSAVVRASDERHLRSVYHELVQR